MSNYPDNISQYNDHPSSPFYDGPEGECLDCGQDAAECFCSVNLEPPEND